jgi:hypothetical protein
VGALDGQRVELVGGAPREPAVQLLQISGAGVDVALAGQERTGQTMKTQLGGRVEDGHGDVGHEKAPGRGTHGQRSTHDPRPSEQATAPPSRSPAAVRSDQAVDAAGVLMLVRPRRLQEGDRIAAVSLSWGGPGTFPHRYEAGKRQLEAAFGVEVVEMPHTLADAATLAADPAARAEDLHRAFADPDIAGVVSTSCRW